MSKRNYDKLDIIAFGEHLLRTEDLDPIYSALVRMEMSAQKRGLWLLSYWIFYHAGVASYLADADTTEEFWLRYRVAADNHLPTPAGDRWPRGHERRHMRGRNAEKTFDHLFRRYRNAPEDFVGAVQASTCGEVMKKVQTHVGFGPWIGFKVADMLERVYGYEVSFDRAEVFIFKDPKKAALLFWKEQTKQPENAKPRDEQQVLKQVVDYLIGEFAVNRRWMAPPTRDRLVGIQEIETILCKWKSHLNGHYPLGNDITEIRAGLQPWLEHSETAQQFLEAMPG